MCKQVDGDFKDWIYFSKHKNEFAFIPFLGIEVVQTEQNTVGVNSSSIP